MQTLPKAAGLRLPHPFLEAFSKTMPSTAWVELCTSYCLIPGGSTQALLQTVSNQYPVVLHDQLLSLGSAEAFDIESLDKLEHTCALFNPVHVVVQLGWSRWHNHHFHDNLPIPYTAESLNRLRSNIHKIQDRLKLAIHIENPARLFQFPENTYPEQDFVAELCATTGCRFRLNINSLYISATNLGLNPVFELSRYPLNAIDFLSIGGHEAKNLSEDWVLLMNSLNSPVAKPVWRLARQTLNTLNKSVPVCLAWEQNLPDIDRLLEEVAKTDALLADTRNYRSVSNKGPYLTSPS